MSMQYVEQNESVAAHAGAKTPHLWRAIAVSCLVNLALIFLLVMAPAATAQELPSRSEPGRPGPGQTFDRASLPQDVFFRGAVGGVVNGVRCATAPVDPLLAKLMDAELRRWRRSQARSGGDQLFALATINVKVAFHVVHSGGNGNVPESWLDQQIVVLNNAFSSSGFRFTKSSVSRTDNSSWYTGCAAGSESAMKNALNVDPERNLNIYTCNPSGGILGYAYLPGDLPAGDARDGVVLLESSLPGGSAAPYNNGDTGTHEVGHYLGLYHTFDPEPNGCSAPGDRVADTPDERSPQYGCPALGSVDSCGSAGKDPVTNFMDYVDDACMDNFTPLQGTRMRDLTALYRPKLNSGGGSGSAPAAPTSLSAATVSGSRIDLSWSDNADNEDGFDLWRRKWDGSSWGSYVKQTLPADSASKSVTGLSSGATYKFFLRASNAVGQSSWVSVTGATTGGAVAPAAPSSLSAATVSGSRIDLTWSDNATNEDGFDLWRKKWNGSSWSAFVKQSLPANSASRSVTGLSSGAKYKFLLRASNGAGQSRWVGVTGVTSGGAVAPAAPGGLSATSVSGSRIDLTWSDNANNETGFDLWRKKWNGSSWGSYVKQTLPADSASRSVTGLTSGATYKFLLRAKNSAGQSKWVSVTGVTSGGGVAPAAPKNLSVDTVTWNRIDLSWTDKANNETGFELWRKKWNGWYWGPYVKQTLPANSTSKSVTGLKSRTWYKFIVRATNDAGESRWASVVERTSR
jgi:hypothetical protein